MRRLIVPTVAALVAGCVGAYAASSSDSPATLCAKKKGGALRLADDGKCTRKEKKLRVNQVVTVRGPAGPPGENGANGANGRDGRDAGPVDYTPEPVTRVSAANTAVDSDCSATAQFCNGSGGWHWQNFGTDNQPVGFWKDRSGVVHLEGYSEQHVGSQNGHGNNTIFVLPDGYRPTARRVFAVSAGANGTLVLSNLTINPDGTVVPASRDGQQLSLDGIEFRP